MDDTQLRKTIGSRTKARRKELGLTLDYLAQKLDVNKSTIQRYERGAIDNTKRLIVEGLANALFVTPEYLKGETDDYSSGINDKKLIQLRDLMETVQKKLPLGIGVADNEFAENLILVMLAEYEQFIKSFTFACQNYGIESKYDHVALMMGETSVEEFNQMSFLREIMHTVNALYELGDILRNYANDNLGAQNRLKLMMEFYDL